MASRTERRFIRGQWVTFEKCDEEILRQAKAVQTARVSGMVTPSKGKAVSRRAAPGHRKGQSIFAGFTARRYAQEKLGPMA